MTYIVEKQKKKKIGGGKAPASPSKVSKLVADAVPASFNPLEQEFDDDAREQLDLRRDKDDREVITCLVEPSVLADLARKERTKSRKRRIIRGTVIFNLF